jgi:hypothetical protein
MDIELMIERIMDAHSFEEALQILFDDERILMRAKDIFEDLYAEDIEGEDA